MIQEVATATAGDSALKQAILLPAFVLGTTGTAAAQAPDADPAEVEKTPQEEVLADTPAPAEDRFSVSLGMDLVSEYVSRGVLFAEEASLQPSIVLNVSLPELEGGAITDANVFVGSWGNVKLGSIPPGPAGQLTRFYETDLYAGIAVELDDRWAVSATYYRYESLGDSFEGYNDLELIISYDDSGWWEGAPLEGFSLSPSLRLVQEAGRPGRKDALYIQPSITPSFDVPVGDRQVRVAIPLMIGLSDEYYDGIDGEKRTFGFFRTGLMLSGQPAPDSIPALTVHGGVDLWIPNDEVISGLSDGEVVGRIGVGWSF